MGLAGDVGDAAQVGAGDGRAIVAPATWSAGVTSSRVSPFLRYILPKSAATMMISSYPPDVGGTARTWPGSKPSVWTVRATAPRETRPLRKRTLTPAVKVPRSSMSDG
ncbi:hypothetical protein SR41_04660 [Sphingomonas melonis]|uniref:Uncharacterized protein n=1 Tax=Sphingomonas melonis TaxID=152682 RepID=A0A0D1KYB6_9SPHN|nr:hypothetical protein SR41_04660 [Sphingomonas melonis]